MSAPGELLNCCNAQGAIQPGERVACLSTNRIEYLDLYFACGKIGAVLVPLNYRFPAAEIVELLEDCQPRLSGLRSDRLPRLRR